MTERALELDDFPRAVGVPTRNGVEVIRVGDRFVPTDPRKAHGTITVRGFSDRHQWDDTDRRGQDAFVDRTSSRRRQSIQTRRLATSAYRRLS